MKSINGSLWFSPTDVLRYLDGNFAAWMERYHFHLGRESSLIPDEESPEDKLVKAHGIRHEQAYLEKLKRAGLPVTVIPEDHSDRVGATLGAIRRGDQVIYQAALEAKPFLGYADFLERRDNPDGTWHYEPWDTKLAHSIKPKFIVQLCAYAEMLGATQGIEPPRRGGAILGTEAREAVDLSEHWYTWRHLRAQFLDFQENFNPASMPPDPSLEREHGQWSSLAKAEFVRRDLVVLAANISLSQAAKLRNSGVTTMAELSTHAERVPKMLPQTFDRLRRQAALQIRSRGSVRPEYEVLEPNPEYPRRGLALLPPPSAGDVYFDIEGYPYARPDGLEYLLGAVIVEGGQPVFLDWWAHDAKEERASFEAFVDWVWARWKQYPDLHIYRYSAYEATALKRLAQRYGSREHEVDQFLRCDVFVDLYTVVRLGVVVGAASYSLKDVERLYLPPREGDVVSAMGSVVAYEDWLASGQSRRWQESPLLEGIRAYNRIDCESTWLLGNWLRERQAESGIAWLPPEVEAQEQTVPTANAMLASELRSRALGEPLEARNITLLTAALLEFHRREDKPAWWDYFRRERYEEAELTDDANCLAGLVRTDTPPRVIKKSRGWEFSFDPSQETKVGKGNSWVLHHNNKLKPEIVSFDGEKGLLEFKTTADVTSWPSRVHLVPEGPMNSGGLTKAMLRFGEAWVGDPDAYPAIGDLLARRTPRLRGEIPNPLIDPGAGDTPQQVLELVRRLDDSVLSIQGPPGTGKSSSAARVIASLLADGCKIAITGQSHRVIINLMEKVRDRIRKQGITAQLFKVGGDREEDGVNGAEWVEKGRDVAGKLGGASALVGITAYGLAYAELEQKFDYVFIDEAGQYSLANAVIAGLAGRNLVLLGDQNQLAQVVQGIHPDGSGASALGHMLAGQEVIQPGFGVLLDVSWRMHPDICRWVSDAFYEGRLSAGPETGERSLDMSEAQCAPNSTLRNSGIVYVPVPHVANTQSSDEEAEAIRDLVDSLVGRILHLSAGSSRQVGLKDILIVAPYNMQVRTIAELIPGARVGTVDKFQGQEAPIVIVSMCASSLEEVPRGAEFLLSPDRLNVAVSRAQVLAIVVASPELLRVRCKTVNEMALMNRHCWLKEYTTNE